MVSIANLCIAPILPGKGSGKCNGSKKNRAIMLRIAVRYSTYLDKLSSSTFCAEQKKESQSRPREISKIKSALWTT